MYAPGDVLVFTVALNELINQYYYLYNISVFTPYPEITYNNKMLRLMKGFKEFELVDLHYIKYLRECDYTGIHFTEAFVRELNEKLNLNIVRENIYPKVHLMEEEKNREFILNKYNIEGKFWLFNAGIKGDIPLKGYPLPYWEEIIESCQNMGIQLIQVGSHKDIHPEFLNVKSLVGKTENLRDFLSLCYHAEGAISPVSLLMHTMAAHRKPCIVLGGGRETVSWEQYPIHKYLNTIGYLKCCRDGGCWKKHRNECINLKKMKNQMVYPECMVMMEPVMVINALCGYEKGMKDD